MKSAEALAEDTVKRLRIKIAKERRNSPRAMDEFRVTRDAEHDVLQCKTCDIYVVFRPGTIDARYIRCKCTEIGSDVRDFSVSLYAMKRPGSTAEGPARGYIHMVDRINGQMNLYPTVETVSI